MGALCGKEDHFDQLGSKGNVLGSSSANAHPTSASTSGPKPATPGKRAQSASTSPPQTLGGRESGQTGGAGGGPDREAVLRAAEARNKASTARGTPGGGKLAAQLNKQSRDGGRADEARREAEQRGEQLVWD